MTDQKQCAKLKNIKCFLFDMDGTINLGNTLIPVSYTHLDVYKRQIMIFAQNHHIIIVQYVKAFFPRPTAVPPRSAPPAARSAG